MTPAAAAVLGELTGVLDILRRSGLTDRALDQAAPREPWPYARWIEASAALALRRHRMTAALLGTADPGAE